MNFTKVVILAGLSGLGGIVIGYFLHILLTLHKKSSVQLKIRQQLLDAKDNAQALITKATSRAEEVIKKAKIEEKEIIATVRKSEDQMREREKKLDQRRDVIEKDEHKITEDIEKLREKKREFDALDEKKREVLERVASLSKEDAKQELLDEIKRRHEEDMITSIRKLEIIRREELEKRAQDMIVGAMQRLASSTAAEGTTTNVPIPSDDIKGKIIGKEGRNIRALERSAGVEIIVDDTPGAIVISSFDPVRRHVAKAALENLIADGRIQPSRIEEVVERANMEVDRIIKEKGDAAAYEVGILDLDPRLLSILGRLHFRTSYGQNVLQHTIEVTHLASMLANELGANVEVAKKGALLHDIGKAMDHEVQGTHVEIGRRILQKFKVSDDVIKAMQAHHEEYPYETIESVIVQVADAISSARPGARRDTLENYLQRLEDLENIATSFEGVEKAYAIQAGREIRVFVTPDSITDLQALDLARKIAGRVEQELKYPGEIKVNVIRELRVVEYAR